MLTVFFTAYSTFKEQTLEPKCFRDRHIYIPGLQKKKTTPKYHSLKIHETLKGVFYYVQHFNYVK